MCIQYLQQECIDSAKQGVPPRPIPSYWNNYEKVKLKIDEETGEVLDSEEEIEWKLFHQSVLTEKKPYYFRYIYKESNKKYLDYIKSMEINALRNFRKSVSEIKSQPMSEEEREFIVYYDKHMPLSDNPCIVNKIAHKVENVFDGDFVAGKNDNFDYSIYMHSKPEDIKISQSIRKKIMDIYTTYKKVSKNKNANITTEENVKEEKTKNENNIYDVFRYDIRQLIENENELCDILIELAYNKEKISKSFVWSMVGDIILDNLLKKNDNTITYPTRDDEGDIVYGGIRFSLKTKKVGV